MVPPVTCVSASLDPESANRAIFGPLVNASGIARLGGTVSQVGSECPVSGREHNDDCAKLDAIVEIDRVLIGHPDATRRNGSTDIFGLIGAVDTVPCVLATRI